MKEQTLARGAVSRRTSAGSQRAGERVRHLEIRNLLVTMDFSTASLQAIEFALPLAIRFGADLHMVHVFESDYSLAAMGAMPLIIPEPEVRRQVRRHLNDVARKYGLDLRRGNIHSLKGRPFEEICRLARNSRTDLIVIATRGNTGLKHLALGSTAERVVRYSPCPVLVVRGAAEKKKSGRNGKTETVLNLKKIIAPIDFSECSMKGLTYAKILAKEFGAKLVLLHSVRLQYYVTSDEYARHDYPLLLQQEEKAVRGQLRDLIRQTDWDGIEIESSLQIGHAGDEICLWARELAADLIVTATHGRTGLKHVLLGSTAEYVVRHASCPVLVVPTRPSEPSINSSKQK
jgi:nucleotide-binding universal stress UspA family protein